MNASVNDPSSHESSHSFTDMSVRYPACVAFRRPSTQDTRDPMIEESVEIHNQNRVFAKITYNNIGIMPKTGTLGHLESKKK